MLKKNNQKIYFIAEAGINHNGKLSLAKKLVLAAKQAGAQAVKFQSFKTEEFLSTKKQTYTYGPKKITINMYKMFKKVEFKKSWYLKIDKLCKKHKIDFLTSVADIDSIKNYLRTKKKIIKIASEDIINYPLLNFLSKLKNKIFLLSTGMADNEEIKKAISILKKNNKIILMHCVSLYPTKLSEANINRINVLKNKFKLEVGYSDHTVGSKAIEVAASLNCRVFEKHFTLNKNLSGPDHHLSLDPKELKKTLSALTEISEIKGKGTINPTGRELISKKIFRRSIVALKFIKKGSVLKKNMIGLKRPASGIHPKFMHKIIGTKAKKSFKVNENISI